MGIFRSTAERLSRDRIIRRRLPPEHGGSLLFVSPDSCLSLLRPKLTSDLFDFAKEFVKPGDVVWDIGANVGLFSFAAAHYAGSAGEVIAVEPDVWLVGLLRQSVSVQPTGAAPIAVLPAAVSDATAICNFNIARRGRSSNYLATSCGGTQTGGVRRTVQVITVTLDWLLTQRRAPKVIKIDVEGAELSVLSGAVRLLREVRPVILCEVTEAARFPVTSLLHSCRYVLYDWESRSAGPLTTAAWNTLALPA